MTDDNNISLAMGKITNSATTWIYIHFVYVIISYYRKSNDFECHKIYNMTKV